MKTSPWFNKLIKLFESRGYNYGQSFVRKYYGRLLFFVSEGVTPEEFLEEYLNGFLEKSKSEYLKVLRDKAETVSLADSIMYQGKILKRCPKGMTRKGNTCIVDPGFKRPGRDSALEASRQIERLSHAKTFKDVETARKYR